MEVTGGEELGELQLHKIRPGEPMSELNTRTRNPCVSEYGKPREPRTQPTNKRMNQGRKKTRTKSSWPPHIWWSSSQLFRGPPRGGIVYGEMRIHERGEPENKEGYWFRGILP